MTLTIFGEDGRLMDERPMVLDASIKGLRFESARELKPGEKFRFNLDVPGHGLVNGTGRACWSRVSDSGITFLCGAELSGMGMFRARALKSYLEPSHVAWGALFDMAFGLGLAYVLLMVAQDLNGQDGRFIAHCFSMMGDCMEWLPQAAMSLGAAFGIYIYFKDR
ncbi:MAG: hypothetical protein HY078_01340 [Elusimicrobia bacterium]|nr:hypothetical protein [Elusimicrobiota bacterium]